MNIDKNMEEQAMAKFRERVKDLNQDERTLIRFLRARNHNIDAAEKMIRHSMEWRVKNDVDNWDKWDINPLVAKSFYIEFSGLDVKNHPVVYMPLGAWPIIPMVEKGYFDDAMKQIIWSMEKIMTEKDKTGDLFTLIIDLEHLSYWTCIHTQGRQGVMEIFRVFESHYPETLHEALLINTPWIFEYGWSFIKPILTGNTLNKVFILGNNDKKYIPALLERMPVSSMVPKLQKLAEKHT